MKRKNFILTFLIMMMSSPFVFGQHWEDPENPGYQNTMTMLAQIYLNDEVQINGDYQVAAFSDNNLIAVSYIQPVTSTTENYHVHLSIPGESGMQINFKLWNGQYEYESLTTTEFEANKMIGSHSYYAKIEFQSVAQVDDNVYSSLQAAVVAAQAGGTVTLLQDVTLAGGYTDMDEGLRIEKALTIDGDNHTINCGSFVKGIRVYNNSGSVATVAFKNVTIKNDNAQGRCIDTRTANIDLDLNNAKLIAQGTNSQPLTIGGSDPAYRVDILSSTIDAGKSGYGVITFVPIEAVVSTGSNTEISGLAALYIKGDANASNVTDINLGHGTYTGTNDYSAESGEFGAVVLEGSYNNVKLTIENATVKAIAPNTAAQAAFNVRGSNNTIEITNNSQVITEGEQAYWAMVSADAQNTVITVNGVSRTLVAECDKIQFLSLADACRFAQAEQTVTVLTDAAGAGLVINKDVTIDLGGKTYTFNQGVGSTGTESNGFQILKGNTVTLKNGTLNVAESAKATFYTIIQNYANLNVIDMTLDGTNLDKWSLTDGDSYVLSNNSGIVNVTGATNITANNDGNKAFAFDVCDKSNNGYTFPTVYVNTTGKIDGKIEVSSTIPNNLNISGGTFTTEIQETWCAEGFIPKQNTDGTWTVEEGSYVAKIGENKYSTLAKAIAAATAGQTVTLIADVTEDVTINKNITLDGANFNYTGTMTGNKGITATIKNVNFVNAGFDKPKGQKSSTGEFTFTSCTFDGQDTYAYPIRVYGAKTVIVENCTVKDYKYSFFYVPSATININIKNVTVDNCPNYAIYFASGVTNATIEKLTVKNSNNGFVINNAADRKLSLKDCQFENVNTAIDHSNETNTITCNLLGANNFGTSASSQYAKYVLAEENATLTAPEGATVTSGVDGKMVIYEDGTYSLGLCVASITANETTTYYETLADAIAAVGTGDVTITLLADATLNYGAREAYGTAETTRLTINGNDHVLTLNQTNSDWSSFGLANASGKVVFNNMTINKIGYGDTNGAWNTHAINFTSNVEMTDVVVNQSMSVQAGATLNNVTINEAGGYYGLWVKATEQTVTMKGGAINATNGSRGIKVADQYIDAPAMVTINVEGTKFNTAKKAAVLVTSTAGAAITATNVDITNVAEDDTNFAWVDEDRAANFGKVTVTGATVAQENLQAFVAALMNDEKVEGYYKTLAEAIAAAENPTVKVINDFDLAESVTIAAGKEVVLDLNNKTITGTDNTSKNFGLIQNNGTLTVDATNGGKMTVNATTNSGWDRYSAVISNNPGATLTVNGGIIEHLGGTDMAYGIDALTNGSIGDVNTTINGGTIKSTYRAVRQFLNSDSKENNLTVNGGTLEGNKSIFFHDPSTKANKGKVTVSKNAKLNGNVYLFVTEGSTEWPVEVAIANFAFQGESTVESKNVPQNYIVKNNNGVWGVFGVVAKIDEVFYSSLAEAFAAATADQTITVINNVTEEFAISNTANVTLDLNGKTLTGAIKPSTANVTIQNGAINNTNSSYSAIEINSGSLNLNGVNITSARHAIRIDGEVEATIVGGEYRGGTTSGTRHALNVSGSANVTIKGGKFVGPKGTSAESGSAVVAQTGSVVTIEGGEFTGGKLNTLSGNVVVKGGKYDQDPTKFMADGYVTVKNSENMYEVFLGLAKIGETYYASIQEAINAAVNNDEIVVLQDIDLSNTEFQVLDNSYDTYFKVEGKTVTIDLNGKTLSGAYTGTNTMLVGVFSTDNNGHLTLTGNGTIDLTATNKVYSLVVCYNDGSTITIEDGTYKLDKASDCLIFYGGTTDKAVTVKGGTFNLGNVGTGANGKPWIFNVVGAGDHHIYVTGGIYPTDVNRQHWSNEVLVAETHYTEINTDSEGNTTYTVKEGAEAYVNTGMTTGPYYAPKNIGYATLEEAIAASQEFDDINVTMLKDVELVSTITIAAGEEVVLDLNGKTVSYTSNVQGEAMITNKGNLTITDNTDAKEGKVAYIYTGTADTNYGKGNYTINNSGTLNVQNVEVTVEAQDCTGKFPHALYVINSSNTLTVYNAKVLNNNNFAIRQLATTANENNIIVKGENTEIKGARAIWIQLPSNAPEQAPIVKLNVENGTLTAIGEGEGENRNELAIYSYSYGQDMKNVGINISGGTFNGDIALTGGKNKENIESLTITGGNFNGLYGEVYSYGDDTKAKEAISIKGGTFETNAAEMYAEDDNFIFVQNENGTYDATPGAYVAAIGETRYSSVAAAINAATADQTINVVKSHELTETVIVNKNVNIAFAEGVQLTSKAYPTAFRIVDDANVIVESADITVAEKGMYNFILGASDASTSGNLTIKGGKFVADVTVASVTRGALVIEGGEFSVSESEYGATYLINCIDANYNEGIATVAIKGGTFYGFDPENNAAEGTATNFCAEGFGTIANENGTWTVMPVQKQYLVKGWNWYSSYLDIETKDLLEALGTNGNSIVLNSTWGSNYYGIDHGGWSNTDHTFDESKMYMIETSQACELNLNGELVNVSEITITLKQGWNWIGYPSNVEVSLSNALNYLEANNGDYIKSQNDGFAEYYGGQWLGAGMTMKPTIGYMYYNSSTEEKTFKYNIVPSRGNNVETEDNYYLADATKYPYNMTVVAVVDDAIGDNYEVAAFVNGEVRGSARPVYIEPMDAYMLFLSISGNDVDEVSFKYYDIDTNTEYDIANRFNYSNNAMLGSVNEPYVFSRGTTGIGEASLSEVNIYPNPTTIGREINLQATCDKVEVFNALGAKIAEYQNVDSIDAFETAGIYVIRLTNDGDVKHCRLIVK